MPFWIDSQLRLDSAKALIKAIERAGEDGLVPADYHLAAMHRLLAQLAKVRKTTQSISPEQLADLDLILTDAFLLLGTHLSIGKVEPETLLARWMIDPGRVWATASSASCSAVCAGPSSKRSGATSHMIVRVPRCCSVHGSTSSFLPYGGRKSIRSE